MSYVALCTVKMLSHTALQKINSNVLCAKKFTYEYISAFGENNTSIGNALHYGPTPCLKIRNMFDSDV